MEWIIDEDKLSIPLFLFVCRNSPSPSSSLVAMASLGGADACQQAGIKPRVHCSLLLPRWKIRIQSRNVKRVPWNAPAPSTFLSSLSSHLDRYCRYRDPQIFIPRRCFIYFPSPLFLSRFFLK